MTETRLAPSGWRPAIAGGDGPRCRLAAGQPQIRGGRDRRVDASPGSCMSAVSVFFVVVVGWWFGWWMLGASRRDHAGAARGGAAPRPRHRLPDCVTTTCSCAGASCSFSIVAVPYGRMQLIDVNRGPLGACARPQRPQVRDGCGDHRGLDSRAARGRCGCPARPARGARRDPEDGAVSDAAGAGRRVPPTRLADGRVAPAVLGVAAAQGRVRAHRDSSVSFWRTCASGSSICSSRGAERPGRWPGRWPRSSGPGDNGDIVATGL